MTRQRRGLCHVLVVAVVLCGCSRDGALADLLGKEPTPHERYATSLRDAGLDATALGRDWLVAADSALREPLLATLPMHEVAIYSREKVHAVTHQVALRDGQRLEVILEIDGVPAHIFVDLFEVTDDAEQPFRHVAHAEVDSSTGVRTLVHEARRAGPHILRLQPELLRDGQYSLTMRTQPVLAFPVSGQGNRAIRSRFGVERDGGARRHDGIDIFAPRGTPVIASVNGVVRSTRPNRLGGNVVWLRDGQRDQSLYYAHLDTQVVAEGQQVLAGDTIGFVGNTGNAVTTPPHLHFGIYRRPGGAIDPFDWVARTDTTAPRITVDTARLGDHVRARLASVPLRTGPDARADTLQPLALGESLQVVGASTSWYRVRRPDGQSGYLRPGSVTPSPR
jgi:murein DD-endopeptidase MepM/ murein hydrolase activator NlpD